MTGLRSVFPPESVTSRYSITIASRRSPVSSDPATGRQVKAHPLGAILFEIIDIASMEAHSFWRPYPP
jgi:hypothetical protein